MILSKFTKELSFPDISKSHTSPLTFHYVLQKVLRYVAIFKLHEWVSYMPTTV